MNIIDEELSKWCDQHNLESEKENDKKNSRPCEKCGGNDFIVLYRNVIGKTEGRLTGYWCLFGGGMNGYIDGYTETLPVLSCTKCHQERLVETYKNIWPKEKFWDDMFNFYNYYEYSKLDKNDVFYPYRQIDSFYLEYPLETRDYMIDHPNFEYDFYNVLPYRSVEYWIKCGFKINVEKIKNRFLFWKWEYYPDWKQVYKKLLNK